MISQLTDFFMWTLTTSAMSSVMILFILLAKLLLKDKLKPRWSYLLWTLLVLRLMLPWTPESSFSVFNILPVEKHETTNERTPIYEQIGSIKSDTFGLNTDQITSMQPNNSAQYNESENVLHENKSKENPIPIIQILSLVWLIGVVSMLGFIIVSNVRFATKLKREPSIQDQTIQTLFEQCKDEMQIKRSITLIESSHVSSPTLFGVIRPKILLQKSVMNALNLSQLRYVFLHEMSHIKRNDIAMNWLLNILLTLHWFNPLLWYAYRKMRDDQEIACDSLALTRVNPEETKEYALTIIRLLENFSNPIRLASSASISSNKNELKRRVIMIASFRNNSYKWSLLGLVVMLLISGCTLTNAKSNDNPQEALTESIEMAFTTEPSVINPDFPVPNDAVLFKGGAKNPNIKNYAKYIWNEADETKSIPDQFLREIEASGWIEKKTEQMGAMRVFEKNGTVMWLTTHDGFITLSEFKKDTNAESKPSVDKSSSDVSVIREAAWTSLNENAKEEVVGDWKSASVEKVELDELPIVQSGGEPPQVVNLYKVTFKTNNDEILGPIQVFINGDTKEIVSYGVRK